MRSLEIPRGLALPLGAAALIAVVVVVSGLNLWILDALTGLAAIAAGFQVCARLALGVPDAATRRAWLGALFLLGLVCASQLAGQPGDRGTSWPVFVDVADGLLLPAAALLLWLGARGEPIPAAARRAFRLAFAIQAAGVAAVLWSHVAGPSGEAMPRLVADFLALLSMLLYALGAAYCVASLRRRLFVEQGRAADVGDFARYLFATSLLFKKVRHPRIGSYTVPGHKLILDIGRLVSWFPKMAPLVRDRFGVGMWRQLCDLYVLAFRHGLDTQAYYMFELFRPEFGARASGYLTRYETKNGLFKVLTWQVPKSQRRIMLGDKLGVSRICEEHGIPTIPILALAEDGQLQRRCERPAEFEQDLFIKPRQAKGSRGAEVIRFTDGKFIAEDGATFDHAGLMELIAQRSKGRAILVQPRIRNHPGIADLADQALIRIRVITCLDQGGNPVITHAVLSNLCKLEPNWVTDFEYGAAINLQSGVLGQMTGDKGRMWLDWFDEHPVTHARVTGRALPCWGEVRSIALAAHAACRDRLLVGWDIAIGPRGALLLEGNSYPDVDFLQRAYRTPIGDSPLGPLLYARLLEIERRTAAGTLRGPLDYDRPGASI